LFGSFVAAVAKPFHTLCPRGLSASSGEDEMGADRSLRCASTAVEDDESGRNGGHLTIGAEVRATKKSAATRRQIRA
jgi:hypothetical protein